jgi:hypothetical protein
MRTITAIVLLSVVALAACSAATDPSQPQSVTPGLSTESTPHPTVAATPGPTVEPSASPLVTVIDRATGEGMLLSGVRQDLQDACAPIGLDLPRSTVAGISCRPASKVIDRVTLYLFRTQEDLLDAYGTWLAAHDIPRRSNGGRCLLDRASEGGYVPGDDHGIVVPERGACQLDADGKAHYVATLVPFVLAEVDGKIGDIAAIEGWAWRGNQDQPGGPTLWRNSDQ